MNGWPFSAYVPRLKHLAEEAVRADKDEELYLTKRSLSPGRNFLIACRHWNSSTPIMPSSRIEPLPYPRLAGCGLGGGYFLVANGVGIAIDPGYGFVQVLYEAYGYTICDIDVVFVTHDHPDHWADLATILMLKHAAAEYDGFSRRLGVYLCTSITDLYRFLSPASSLGRTIRPGQIVRLTGTDHAKVADVTALKAFHNERLCPHGSSPHAMGLHFKIEPSVFGKLGLRNIAITGDTQFPSLDKQKKGLLEFTERDVEAFKNEYDSGPCGGTSSDSPRGNREIDVLAMHIGSVEHAMTDLPVDGALEFIKKKVFYQGYHLGFAGCLKMLDMVFRNDQAQKVAILTEFGEELRGHRVDIARMLERATRANPRHWANVSVLPADVGMALELTWDSRDIEDTGDASQGPKLRCNKCLRMKEAKFRPKDKNDKVDLMDPSLFHPISMMDVFEDLDTGLIQYCCRA